MDSNETFDRPLARRQLLKGTALAGLGLAGGSSLLAACGGSDSGGSSGPAASGDKIGGAITWASWANPGEAERFKQYSKDYQAKYGTKVTYQTIVGDYQTKLLTQLAGGAAADAFYVGDGSMAKMIETGQLEKLDE